MKDLGSCVSFAQLMANDTGKTFEIIKRGLCYDFFEQGQVPLGHDSIKTITPEEKKTAKKK